MKFSHYAVRTTLGRGLSTLTCHGNGVFGTRSSNRRNLKTPSLRFSVNGIHFENGAFGERWRHDTFFTWFPWPSFSKRRIQNNRRYFTGVVWAGYNEAVSHCTKDSVPVLQVKNPLALFFVAFLMLGNCESWSSGKLAHTCCHQWNTLTLGLHSFFYI